jgi:PAS domain-containing protein
VITQLALYRALVEAQLKTAETFEFDYVSVISDPAREAAAQEDLVHGLRAMVEGDLRLLAAASERRRLEGELGRLEEKFRAYYDGNPIPTFTWQKKGEDLVLIECNQAARSITRRVLIFFE